MTDRLLAWPRQFQLNPMPGMIYDGLEREHGWSIAGFRYWRAPLGRYSLLHVSFPNAVFRNRSRFVTGVRAAMAVASIKVAKLRRKRVVWTVHNIADHEAYHSALEARFMRWFASQVDLVIHMSEDGKRAALRHYPQLASTRSATIPHPHYGTAARTAMPRGDALGVLGLAPDCRLVLAFGVVRRYKNLLTLARAFLGLPQDKARLLIAGMPLDLKLAHHLRKLAVDDRVILMLRAVEAESIGTLFGAARLVVAPYVDILNSGTALLSLTYGRPVLVPNRGAMADLQRAVGEDWVRLYEPALNELVLGAALQWAAMPRAAGPDLTRFDPETIVAAYATEFAQLVD